jgi:hypothetical protein
MVASLIYEKASGEVIKTILAPDGHDVPISDGQSLIEGQYEDDKFYIKDGQPQKREAISGPKDDKTPKPMNAAEARLTRDNILSKTDWTQLPDAPVDKEAWATYRQALRDITEQDGFPKDVEWPTRP